MNHLEVDRRLLIVDDDEVMQKLLAKHLSSAGYDVLTASNGKEAFHVLLTEGPPVVITDWMMPEMDGLDLCRTIRGAEGVGFVYVIILTAHSEKERVVEAFEAGADDFLSKPFHRQELIARVNAGIRIVRLEADLARQNRMIHKVNADMAILNRKLERLATTDELTGLMNRREAMRRLHECWSNARRHQRPLACIMIDIDHFKLFNDRYGHHIGDVVLADVGSAIRQNSRAGDVACRFGGEELLLICPETGGDEAAQLAERLRQVIEHRHVRNGDREFSVTISAGSAAISDDVADGEDLIRRADRALYAAKREGRNRASCFDASSSSSDLPPPGASLAPTTAQQEPTPASPSRTSSQQKTATEHSG